MSQLDELRQIIVGDNSEQLSKLKERVESIDARTRDVAEVLAPAIEASVSESTTLIKALETPVSEGLKRAIRREPKDYAEILYPVMSPAIRRAIASAISSLLTTINQTVESATSVNGIKTRFESMTTGVPYAELALRKSLVYRVEHVYLIDRETGLLVAELKNSEAHSLDSDAVSAMFSAIQSFVQDSFSNNKEDRLTDLTVGEHRVWVVHGPQVMLACVIRGQAPLSLKEELTDVLDQIRTDYAQAISDFDGDVSRFAGIDDYLQPCLQLELKENSGKKKFSRFTLFLGVLALLGVGYLVFHWVKKQQEIQTVQQILLETPGYIATNIEWRGAQMVVRGLKDPYAQIPQNEFDKHKLDSPKINWQMKPYQSLEPEILLRRLNNSFSIPNGVRATIEGESLFLDGAIDFSWLIDNEKKLRQSNLFTHVDITGLSVDAKTLSQFIDSRIGLPDNVAMNLDKGLLNVIGVLNADWQEQLENLFSDSLQVGEIQYQINVVEERESLIEKMNSTIIYFMQNIELTERSKQVLNNLKVDIQKLTQLIKPAGTVELQLFGQTDDTGSKAANDGLRRDREQEIKRLLTGSHSKLKIVVGEFTQGQSSAYNERSIRVEVKIK